MDCDAAMTPEAFVRSYEQALASQNWRVVEPLIHVDACVTFSNGAVHQGREAVGRAFARNFLLIRNERYAISNVRWVRRADDIGVYLFDFSWQGLMDGKEVGGAGCGTAVLVCEKGRWLLLAEHLGPTGGSP